MGRGNIKKKIVINVLLIITFVVSLALYFAPPKMWIMKSNQERPYKVVKSEDINPTVADDTDQKEATFENVMEARKHQTNAVGKVIIPQANVGISLPILQGIGYYNMLAGAGEQMPRSVVGPGGNGNYILASHYTPWANILFTNLGKTKVGSMVYVADTENVYVYQVDNVILTTISHREFLDQPEDKDTKMITLYTCQYYGSPKRWVVQGKLVAKTPLNEIDTETKNAFADWLSAIGKD